MFELLPRPLFWQSVNTVATNARLTHKRHTDDMSAAVVYALLVIIFVVVVACLVAARFMAPPRTLPNVDARRCDSSPRNSVSLAKREKRRSSRRAVVESHSQRDRADRRTTPLVVVDNCEPSLVDLAFSASTKVRAVTNASSAGEGASTDGWNDLAPSTSSRSYDPTPAKRNIVDTMKVVTVDGRRCYQVGDRPNQQSGRGNYSAISIGDLPIKRDTLRT